LNQLCGLNNMMQKGGDPIWLKKTVRFWDQCTRKAIPCEKQSAAFVAVAEHAVELFAGILAFSLLGIWAELTFLAPVGIFIKYGLTAVFAVSYAWYTGVTPAQMGIVKTGKAWFLLLFVLAPNGVFRLFQCACEEFIYRGAIFASASRWWGVAAGFTVSTVAFVVMHPGAGVVAWAVQAGFGLFACWWMLERKEIWGIIAIHTAWNLLYDLRLAVGL
jgi:membrane protease YdiL (CAAX protease family)